MKVPPTVVIGVLAVIVVGVLFAIVEKRTTTARIDAGFWWDQTALQSQPDNLARLGSPLTGREFEVIQQASRDEVRSAFSDLRIEITDHRNAFWRVAVV